MKSEKQEEDSMVGLPLHVQPYTYVYYLYYLACPRGHPYFVGEVILFY